MSSENRKYKNLFNSESLELRHKKLRPLKEKLQAVALTSPEFKEELKYATAEIVRGAHTAENEATIESIFERVMYAVMREIGIPFNPQKEAIVDTRRHTGKGRADSRIGAVVIEYKHRTKLRTDEDIKSAMKQLSDYISPLSQESQRETIGFLTDGIQFYETRAYDGTIIAVSGKADVNAKTLLTFIRCVVSLEQSALTPENLIRDFCGILYDGVLFDVARMLNKILTNTATVKTRMLMSEWEELFRLAHDDRSQQKRIQERRAALSDILKEQLSDAASEYRALFSLHTSYAIIVKLIALRVIADIQFGLPLQDYKSLISARSEALHSFCASLEDGEIFRKLGILNLLEGDFFSWYSDEKQWDKELAEGIRQILSILSRYEDIATVFSSADAIQLFRELYEATVPQIVRASFGEFNTPYWLAQHVLQSSELKDNWRALDPCCGSGTFVIAAISQIRKDKKDSPNDVILSEILNRVSAIDLNPLMVLTTRVHYFIHIASLLPLNLENLVIPVFLGDSSYMPEKVNISGVECLKYKLHTHDEPIDIVMPISLVKNTPTFVQLMYRYEQSVRKRKLQDATKLLMEAIERKDRNSAIEKLILGLTKQLVELQTNERNGIWARIITNFLSTACLKPFTNIIGNPPWIDWKNLPSSYREKIKSICIDKGLFSGAGRTGGINLNICALITHVATNWLRDDGRLAFLLPRELAYQPSYEGWLRSVGGANRTILKFHDWSKVGHPFYPVTEDFMTYILGPKNADNNERAIIPAIHYIRKSNCKTRANTWKSLEDALNNLDVSDGIAGQIIPNSAAFTFARDIEQLNQFSKVAGECAYIGREGIEFYPQELFIFTYDGAGPKQGTVFVRNIKVAKSKYPIPSQRILLESKYLYPLVKGQGIERFWYKDKDVIVAFPYEEEVSNRPVDAERLETESKLLLEYYEKYRRIIDMQTEFSNKIRGPDAGEYYGLARTGSYSFQDVYVTFRDNTKWRAAVVTNKQMPWGETKRFVFQNHAVSMCERKDGSGYISKDEAHYICAILNADIVEQYLYGSSDQRSFRIRPPVFVPKYDETNPFHRKLSVLSYRASKDRDSINEIRREIEEIYLAICEGNKN